MYTQKQSAQYKRTFIICAFVTIGLYSLHRHTCNHTIVQLESCRCFLSHLRFYRHLVIWHYCKIFIESTMWIQNLIGLLSYNLNRKNQMTLRRNSIVHTAKFRYSEHWQFGCMHMYDCTVYVYCNVFDFVI